MIRTGDGRLKLSASRLKTWLSCPMKWAAVYIDERPLKTTPSMAFGTALHRALEEEHRARWLGHQAPELLDVFAEALDRSGAEVPLAERQKMLRQASSLLDLYLEQYADEQVLAAELELTAPVIDPVTGEDLGELTGIIDLVTADGHLVDLKTSARAPSGLQAVLANAIQLDCYRYLVDSNQPDLDIRGGEIRSLIRTKVPRVETTELPLRPFDGLFDLVRRYKRAVEELEIYPRPGILCEDSCPAIEACRSHHGLEVPA